MNSYIDRNRSIGTITYGNDELILKTMAEHFIGNNLEQPYQFKVDFKDKIKMNTDGQYLFNFNDYFENVPNGYKCAAEGKVYSYDEEVTKYKILCIGPTTCYVNDELVFKSDPDSEGERKLCFIEVTLHKGYNKFKFITEKTNLGFGFTFGQTLPQWIPHLFNAVPEENNGQIGFRYSAPFEANDDELSQQLAYPILPKNSIEEDIPNGQEAFGSDFKGYVYAKSKFIVKNDTNLKIKGDGTEKISVNGSEFKDIGNCQLKKGEHTVVIEFNGSSDLLFNLQNIEIVPVVNVLGYKAKWLYLGILECKVENHMDLLKMEMVFGDNETKCYWKPLPCNMVLRPTVESELYGRFTYPMGVTLYGLLECADFLNIERYKQYVLNDVKQIAKFHNYALFDKKRSGFPSLNQQISWLRELDDCGSFGSIMLESLKYDKIDEVMPIVHNIADYMINKQRRESDGAYSRDSENMWIDDMYMCVPFLSRYYELTGDEVYLNEAVNQMLHFERYFFINQTNLMAHIYDVNWKKANDIPWSRGNGWVVFAMSELLQVLPKNHCKREDIIRFFNNMVEGLLKVQDESGLWHQVLDSPDTYLESSSTAMFICAFARSIKEGYCETSKKETLLDSINKAWSGLINIAIDENGNLYGVCRGSGCSFSREYYKNLSWRYNDAHGIGIVIFAGVERLKLLEFLK